MALETEVDALKTAIDNLAARALVSDESMAHLKSMYSMIWTEARYDAATVASKGFAERLLPHIEALNKELRFKA